MFNFCIFRPEEFFLAYKLPIGSLVDNIAETDQEGVSSNKIHAESSNDDLDAWLSDIEFIKDDTSPFFFLFFMMQKRYKYD